MLPVRTILHPTDYSEHSHYAFGLACALARDRGARLVVLHVAPPLAAVFAEGVVVPEPEEYQERLLEELRHVVPEDPQVAVDHRLAEGEPVEEVLRAAAEVHSDLIVMGTHGRTGWGRLLMGSVAEQVVRRAPCPVVTLKSPPRPAPAAGEAVQPAAVGK